MSAEPDQPTRFRDRVRRFPNSSLREAIYELRIEKLNELYREMVREGFTASEAKEECSKKLNSLKSFTTSKPNKRNPARRGIRDPRELSDILSLRVVQCEVDRPNAPAGYVFTVRYHGSMRQYHISHALVAKINHLKERPALMDASLSTQQSVRRQASQRKVHYHTEERRRLNGDSTASRTSFNRNLRTRVNPNSNEQGDK